MVKRLSLSLACLFTLCSATASAQQVPGEKNYRQAAWAFYLQQPAKALETLQLAPQYDARTQLFEAGLYLQLGMPQHAARVLEPLVQQQSGPLEQSLLNIALLQFARYQLELGNKAAAKQYLTRVNLTTDKRWLGQQQLLSQLIDWPQIQIPEQPEFGLLRQQAEMPYIVSNQALALAAQQPERALQWLDGLQQQVQLPLQQSFWQLLFSGQWQLLFRGDWHLVSPPAGFVYADDEFVALTDYVKMLQAQLYISQQDFAAADAILSDFAADSVLSPAALQLYSLILTEQRHIPTLLAVLQQQIRLQPFSNIAWQAATRIGEQLERALQQQDALAAYRWADQYFEQQRQLIEQQASPLQVSQLEQGLSDWQRLQVSQHDELHRLQQDIKAIQQQLAEAPSRQQRLTLLEQVTRFKLAQQTELLTTQLTPLENRRQHLVQQLTSLRQSIAAEQSSALSLLLTDGDSHRQLAALQRIEKRLSDIKSQLTDTTATGYQQRLLRLRGLMQWQYYEQGAERVIERQRLLQELDKRLLELDSKLAALRQQSQKAPRLSQIEQRLNELNTKQQQLNLALLSQQQRLLAQLNQQLQQRRQQDLALLSDLQRFNKEATARVMEQVLRMAHQTPQEVGNE